MSFLEALPLLASGIGGCLLVAVLAGYLGVHVILRRIVFVSATLSQVASLGIALVFLGGALAGSEAAESWAPVGSVATTSLLALWLAPRHHERRLTRESFLGWLYALSSGLVLVILDKTARDTHDVDNVLFGNAVFVSDAKLITLTLTVLVLGVLHVTCCRRWTAVAYDPETSMASGLPVLRLNRLFYLALAWVIAVSITAIGALPVFGLLVLPSSAALLLVSRLDLAFALSIAFSVLATAVGFYLSFAWSLPTGPSLICTAALLLVPGLIRSAVKRD